MLGVACSIDLADSPENQDPGALVESLLADGDHEAALEAVERAIRSDPDNGRLVMLRGIALGQLGRVDEARGELRRSTMLSPTNPRTFYNLAVQLYDEGDRKEAASMAQEALRLDPSDRAAADLLNKCGTEPGEAPFEVGQTLVAPTRLSVRPGTDDPQPHVLGLGTPWTRIGYGLLALCVLEDLLLIVHAPFAHDLKPRPDALSVLGIFLWIFVGIATVFWMFLDIFDRRKRFVWLLPLSICGLVGLPIVFLGLYLWLEPRRD